MKKNGNYISKKELLIKVTEGFARFDERMNTLDGDNRKTKKQFLYLASIIILVEIINLLIQLMK